MTYTEAVKAYGQMMGISATEAKEDAERMVKQWMSEGMSREFAENTFIEEQEDADPALLQKMEADAKANGAKAKASKKPANYSMQDAAKKRAPRKPNEAKRALIAKIAEALEGCEVINPERQIDLVWDGVNYSVTLTAHRPKKEKA